MIDQRKIDWLKEIGAKEVSGEDSYLYTFDGFEEEKLYISKAEIEAKPIEELKLKRYLERERICREAWDRGIKIVSAKSEGFVFDLICPQDGIQRTPVDTSYSFDTIYSLVLWLHAIAHQVSPAPALVDLALRSPFPAEQAHTSGG